MKNLSLVALSMGRIVFHILAISALVIVPLTLTGCTPSIVDNILGQFVHSFGQSVVVKEGNNALPTTTLTVPDLGNGKMVLHTGDQPATVHIGQLKSDAFFVVAAADDADGVQAVCFKFEEERICTCNGVEQKQYVNYPYPVCDGTSVAPGGNATTRRWLPYLVDKSLHSACPHGCQGEDSFTVTALGRNFSNQQTASAPVTFINP